MYSYIILIGPAVGSFLYEIGGFKLPFMVVGALGILISFGLYLTIPDLEKVIVKAKPLGMDSH